MPECYLSMLAAAAAHVLVTLQQPDPIPALFPDPVIALVPDPAPTLVPVPVPAFVPSLTPAPVPVPAPEIQLLLTYTPTASINTLRNGS